MTALLARQGSFKITIGHYPPVTDWFATDRLRERSQQYKFPFGTHADLIIDTGALHCSWRTLPDLPANCGKHATNKC
jgi:hypothetical protein